jgi:hypothetical protein
MLTAKVVIFHKQFEFPGPRQDGKASPMTTGNILSTSTPNMDDKSTLVLN